MKPTKLAPIVVWAGSALAASGMLAVSFCVARIDPTTLFPTKLWQGFQIGATLLIWLVCSAHRQLGLSDAEPWPPWRLPHVPAPATPQRRTLIVVAVICLLGTAFQRLVLRPDSTFGFPEVITLLQAGRLAECAIIPVLVAIGTYNRSPRVTALMLFVSFLILAVGWLHSSLPSTALFAIAALPLGLMFNFRDARALMNLANVALMIAVMSMPFLYFWITTYCGYAALKFWRSSKPESTNTTP